MARLTIDDLNVDNKRVLVRVDFNVPLDDNQNITDDFRIQAALPTIKKLLEKGGKLILMSHLGRPKGERKPQFSLKPVADRLQQLLDTNVKFADDCIGDGVKKLAEALEKGEVLLLENLRYHNAEKKNDPEFSKQLADLADVYVNDAFGTSHRAHASMAGAAEYFEQRAAGYLLEKELFFLSDKLENPERPYTAILGGAKVSGKIEIIEQLINKVDNLLVGGAMCFTFFKAQGYETGKSLVEDDKVELAKELMAKAEAKGCKLYLPVDAIAVKEIDENAEITVCGVEKVPADQMGVDIGPKTIELYNEILNSSKTVLWNGPMGIFEMAPFAKGTEAVAHKLADITSDDVITVIGGGDSAAAIKKFGLSQKVTHVSTGGGASLELLGGLELVPVGLISEK